VTPDGWAGAAIGFVGGVGLLMIYQRLRARTLTLDQRVAPYLGGSSARSDLLREQRALTPFPTLERLIAPALRDGAAFVARWGRPTVELSSRLERAAWNVSVDEFRVRQLAGGAIGLACGLALAVVLGTTRGSAVPALFVLVLMAGVAGALVPEQRLSAAIAARERAMMLEFPTIAELLALAVAAGESPVAALERVCATARGQLSVDLRRSLADVHAGSTLAQALERLGERSSLPSVSRFAEGVSVAIERGTPLADVLRAQAQDAREFGRRNLMEIGGRKEVAMMVPVVFLILPVTVVFAVFPSVLTLQLGL